MCIKWDAETTGRRYKCLRNMETKNPDTPYTLSLWSNLIAKEDKEKIQNMETVLAQTDL